MIATELDALAEVALQKKKFEHLMLYLKDTEEYIAKSSDQDQEFIAKMRGSMVMALNRGQISAEGYAAFETRMAAQDMLVAQRMAEYTLVKEAHTVEWHKMVNAPDRVFPATPPASPMRPVNPTRYYVTSLANSCPWE